METSTTAESTAHKAEKAVKSVASKATGKKSSASKAKSKSTSKKAGARPSSEAHGIADEVISYLEERAKTMDKATIAKYVGATVLVLYGIRKSSILRSLAMTLVTGMASKFLAEKLEEQVDVPEAA